MALEAYVNGQRKKAPEKKGVTIRLELELRAPNEESTNEYSYTQLVEEAAGKVPF